MATMRFHSPDTSSAAGLGWSLSHWPGRDPAEVEDDRPKATATEKLYRYRLGSWRLAYAIDDEYPLEEAHELKTWAEIEDEATRRARQELQKAAVPEVVPASPEVTGRTCPECGVPLPERGFGPHLAKHRRDKAAT